MVLICEFIAINEEWSFLKYITFELTFKIIVERPDCRSNGGIPFTF